MFTAKPALGDDNFNDFVDKVQGAKILEKKPICVQAWYNLQYEADKAAHELKSSFEGVLSIARSNTDFQSALQYDKKLQSYFNNMSDQYVKLSESVEKSRLAIYLLWFAEQHGEWLYNEYFKQRDLKKLKLSFNDSDLMPEIKESQTKVEKDKNKARRDKDQKKKQNPNAKPGFDRPGRVGLNGTGRGGGQPYQYQPNPNQYQFAPPQNQQWPGNNQFFQNKRSFPHNPQQFAQHAAPGFGQRP